MITFTWDPNKNLINQQKHGVSFEEASTVFYDENALIEYDSMHSFDEQRFRIIGCSNVGNVLIVVHCAKEDNLIRIISCRMATTKESKEYVRRSIL